MATANKNIIRYLPTMNKTLSQLYSEHAGKVSDKWAIYLPEYDVIFGEIQDHPVRLLEIGVQNGGGLEIWAKYFKNGSKFVGCDVNPQCGQLSFDDPRINLIIGDANSDPAQEEILAHSPMFEIMIDDGSHRSSDIIRSFARYFPFLVDGGVYICEDLHASYWQEFEGGLFFPFSAISFFKRLVDAIHQEHWGVDRSSASIFKGFKEQYGIDLQAGMLAHIHSIRFINSFCIIQKRSPFENELGNRLLVGSSAAVNSEIIQYSNIKSSPLPQSDNQWSTRIVPPDEDAIRLEEALMVQNSNNARLKLELDEIKRSKIYLAGLKLRKIRLAILPVGSRRERMLKRLFRSMNVSK